MDKEFEEWFLEAFECEPKEISHVDLNAIQAAWNASKKYRLNKTISQRECYQRGFNAGLDKAIEVATDNSPEHYEGEIAEAIKELK